MLNTVREAVEEIGKGNIVVVVDDEDRENEGDLIMAASRISADAVNFMATYGKGLICVPMDSSYAGKFGLSSMVVNNTEIMTTNFTVSVDLKGETTTGISMSDRAKTIRALSESDRKPGDFLRPGHVFPIIAKDGGVRERRGHTEAAVDLAKLAGFSPVGVLCEIILDNGEMARFDDLRKFCEHHELKFISIADLIEYFNWS